MKTNYVTFFLENNRFPITGYFLKVDLIFVSFLSLLNKKNRKKIASWHSKNICIYSLHTGKFPAHSDNSKKSYENIIPKTKRRKNAI